MSILLIGSKTIFGNAILQYLLEKTNYNIIVPNGIPSNNPRITALAIKYTTNIDIRDKKFVKEKAEVLINAIDEDWRSLKKNAIKNTIRSMKWLKFFNKCKQPKKYIYISSAFVNFHRKNDGMIKEKIYEKKMNEGDLIDIMNDIKTSYAPYHNSYLYSKQLSEILLQSTKKNFELSILRPSILMPAVETPYSGWGACNTLTNMLYGIGTGLIPCWNISREDIFRNNINSVPIDIAAQDCISMIDNSGSEIRHCCFTGNNPYPLTFYTFFFYTFEAYRYFSKKPIITKKHTFQPYYPIYSKDCSTVSLLSILWSYICDLFIQRQNSKHFFNLLLLMIKKTIKANKSLPYFCSKKVYFHRKKRDAWFLKKYAHNKSFKRFIEDMHKNDKISF